MIKPEILLAFAEAINADYARSCGGTHARSVEITFEPGNRWIRVVRSEGFSRSVHSFIESSTGDVYKAASWKTPAKGKRGSVFELTPRITAWTSAS